MNLDAINKRLEEIEQRKIELEEAILSIDLKLEEVKLEQITTGNMPNTKWLYRAKHALGCKKIELKKLNIERESLKKIAKLKEKEQIQIRTECFERNFINVAKEILSKEEFDKIKKLALKLTDEKEVKENRGTLWSKEDEEYLKNNYKNSTIEELSITLGRSENAIRSKVQIIKKKKEVK